MPERLPRLFVETPLGASAEVECNAQQGNYLVNVLRCKVGDEVLLFNGRDGEWRAALIDIRRSQCRLRASEQTRPQDAAQDIHYLFAPLKHARLDYMVQKATELGVCALQPVVTAHTVAGRVNIERMRANAIEAAEQCGILSVPAVAAAQPLATVLRAWPKERNLIFCDESAGLSAPIAALQRVPPGPLGVLVGPEGGFSEGERQNLLSQPFVYGISLGPRIMRADTAAVAAVALVNAVLGDWQ